MNSISDNLIDGLYECGFAIYYNKSQSPDIWGVIKTFALNIANNW